MKFNTNMWTFENPELLNFPGGNPSVGLPSQDSNTQYTNQRNVTYESTFARK